MPEEQVVGQSAAPQQEPQANAQPQPESQEEEVLEETAGKEEEKPEKNRLVTLLAALLAVCLIAEVALAAYIGLTLYENAQNQRILTAQYEAYVALQAEQQQNPPLVQYIGPTVRVVDGVLVDDYAAAAAARAQAEANIPGI